MNDWFGASSSGSYICDCYNPYVQAASAVYAAAAGSKKNSACAQQVEVSTVIHVF